LAAERFANCVPTTIVRPGIVFGPENRELLPVFQSIAMLRLHLVPTWDPPRLSLIFIDDLIALLIDAETRGRRVAPLESNDGKGYYFACAPEYPTYLQLGRMIANGLDLRRIVLLPLANPLPWLVASANELVSRLAGRTDHLTIDKMREATANSWACSTQAIHNELNFSFPRSLEERLRETACWYRDNGLLRPFPRERASISPSHSDHRVVA
jgi:nucleoside-diphosphate-sugar epimerase